MIDRSRPVVPHAETDRRQASRRQLDRRVADRRRDERYRVVAQLRFVRSGGAPECVLPGEVFDASYSGLRILVDEPLQTPESLLIEIREGQDLSLNLTARLIWCEPFDADRFQAGCELSTDLTKLQLTQLKALTRPPRSS